MRKFQRLEEPDFLRDNWENWGASWHARHTADKSSNFHWHTHDKVPVNQKLLPLLKAQTQEHCSFCDNWPVSPPSDDTIEHFRPKTKYHLLAYKWDNLYYCCRACQAKGGEFDNSALCPDAIDYEFDRYFRWDFTTGEIRVNEMATEEDQKRADVTIRLYRLNVDHPRLRKLHLARRAKCQDEPLDEWPYRDFLKCP